MHSACILCSNGCGLDIAVKDGRIVGVCGDPRHPVNFGHLGPKGENAWVANSDPRRGTRPMIRRKKTEKPSVETSSGRTRCVVRIRKSPDAELKFGTAR